jgi:hypothetical protein
MPPYSSEYDVPLVATVVATDRNHQVVPLPAVPTWSFSGLTGVNTSVSPDGSSAVFSAPGPGTLTVGVAVAGLGDTETIEFTPLPATAVSITFAPAPAPAAEPKPAAA